MGYYSDVKYVIQFPNKEAAKGFIAVHRIDPVAKAALDKLKYISEGTDLPALVGVFNGVKWYTEFPEVQMHHGLIEAAKEQGFATGFVCVGEEGEFETDYNEGEHDAYAAATNLEYIVYPIRTVELDVDVGKGKSVESIFEEEHHADN